MQRSVALTALFAVCVASFADVADAGGDLQTRLQKEAPAKWREYSVRAKKIQATITLTESDTSPTILRTTRTDILKQRPGSALLIRGPEIVVEGDKARGNTGATVVCQNPVYSFELARSDPLGAWTASALEIGNVKPLKSIQRPVVDHVVDSGINLHFRGGLPKAMAELLSDSAFVIKKCSHDNSEAGRRVRVEFKYTDQKLARSIEGWALLEPDRYWQICEFVGTTVTADFTGTYHVKFECVDAPGGFPILKRSEGESDGKDKKGRVYTWKKTVDWDCREDGNVPEREFKLSAFGLPEPMEPAETGGARYFTWFMCIAAVCFAMAGAFMIVKKRRASLETSQT